MKQIRITLTVIMSLVTCVLSLAQNVIIEGTNLNIGEHNTLTSDGDGMRGHAIGRYNIVESHNALAVGYGDTINQLSSNSFALGTSNRIGGSASMGIGQNVKVLGDYSFGVGRYLKATGDDECMIIGNGFYGPGSTPSLYFENQYSYSLMIGFHSTKPTLTVGPSPNDYPQGDTINKTGKVAIGDVPVPHIAAKLHIRADYGEDAGIILEPKDLERSNTFVRLRDESHQIQVDRDGNMSIESMDGNNCMPLLLTGRVGVNVPNVNKLVPEYALCVHGGIITEKVNIKSYSEWHDYVFAPDYALMPLSQLKDYVTVNHHLPDIPSEQEVLSQGLEIGEMQGLLLKKIEELTLYSIQLQEQMESMQKEIDELKNK